MKVNLSDPTLKKRKHKIEKYPVPDYVYQVVRDHLQDVPLDELKKELEVSKRVARALRDNVHVELSFYNLMALESNIGFLQRYSHRNRLKVTIEDSCFGDLYVGLNRYLAKIIADMPEDMMKLINGGWMTKHIKGLNPWFPWTNLTHAFLTLANLKRWFTKIHKKWPEFDQVLFAGTGLFSDIPDTGMKHEPIGQIKNPIRKVKKKYPAHRMSRKRREAIERFEAACVPLDKMAQFLYSRNRQA